MQTRFSSRLFGFAYAVLAGAAAGVGGLTQAQPADQAQAVNNSAQAALPFVIERIETECEDGPIRGWFARVDLADPRLDVLVTAPLPESQYPTEVESVLTATDAWARGHGAALAINANFFRWIKNTNGDSDGTSDIMGLSVSEGRVVSPPRHWEGHGDPVLVFTADRHASIIELNADDDATGYEEAVAGIGNAKGDPDHGGLLIDDGQDRGALARVAPSVRHPRTAVGVDRDGRVLMLLIIDGRQPEWSVGATLPDMSRMLLERGAFDAVALDGGGSSSFYFDLDPNDNIAPQINRPSDGRFRPVANHLGFRLLDAAADAADATTNTQAPSPHPRQAPPGASATIPENPSP